MQHAKNRLEDKNISATDKENVTNVLNYLQGLGNADNKATNLDMTDEEKQKLVGQYRFGDGENEIFIVDLHPRKFLQIGRKGAFQRVLNKVDENSFSPVGAPSVKVVFKIQNDKAISLSVHEPEPLVVAARIA